MKIIKIIAAVVISLALLAGEGFLMAAVSFDKALSADSLKEAMVENHIVDDMVDEALSESTVSMGGAYGDMVAAIMKTEAMTDFLTDFAEAAIDHQIYGKAYREIGTDQLMGAFTRGVEEINSEGRISISPLEEELMKQELLKEAPDVTASLNSLVEQYDSLGGQQAGDTLEADYGTELLTGTGTRAAAAALCIAAVAALIAMFWRSRLGFIWCAAVTAVAASVYMLISTDGVLRIAGENMTALDNMALDMLATGFKTAAAAGYIISVVLIIICIIARALSRRKTR